MWGELRRSLRSPEEKTNQPLPPAALIQSENKKTHASDSAGQPPRALACDKTFWWIFIWSKINAY